MCRPTGDSRTDGSGCGPLERGFPASSGRLLGRQLRQSVAPRVHKLISTLTAKIVRNAFAGCLARSAVDYNRSLSGGLLPTSQSGRINETGATGDNDILDVCAVRSYADAT